MDDSDFWRDANYRQKARADEAEAKCLELQKRIAHLEAAFRWLQGWDWLNPPRTNLCADLSWVKRLVDNAMAGTEIAPKAVSIG